jgi:hypothetical protein
MAGIASIQESSCDRAAGGDVRIVHGQRNLLGARRFMNRAQGKTSPVVSSGSGLCRNSGNHKE